MLQIANYLTNCHRLFKIGNAREYSYKSNLKQLLNKIIATNEHSRITYVGALNYNITKKRLSRVG